MTTALQRGLAVCHTCLALNPVHAGDAVCRRCGSRQHARIPNSVERTMSLLIAAVILYIPANVLPIMITDQFGRATESTIIGGVILLWKHDAIPVALIILIASVAVPQGKIIALCILCWIVTHGLPESERQRIKLFRVIEFIGKWSMVDVFVVAILVALLQIGGILAIRPGAGALVFAGVVILTMLAAQSFDPRLIWDQPAANHE